MKRALNNLLINTLLYSGADARIGVEIISGVPCQIRIWDEGEGMTETQINRLFDRYYRGVSAGADSGGTGLAWPLPGRSSRCTAEKFRWTAVWGPDYV